MLKLIFHKDNNSKKFSVKMEACNLKLTARRFNELAFRQPADRGAAFFARPTKRVKSPGCGFVSVVRAGQSR